IRTALATQYPIAAARRAAAPPRPEASRRLGTAGHSRPGHPLPSRRLWRLRVGRWGRRFWGRELTHAAHNTLGLESFKRGLSNVLDVPADVADGLGQRLAGLGVKLGKDLLDNLATKCHKFFPARLALRHRLPQRRRGR